MLSGVKQILSAAGVAVAAAMCAGVATAGGAAGQGYEGWAFAASGETALKRLSASYKHSQSGMATGRLSSPDRRERGALGIRLSHSYASGLALDAGLARSTEEVRLEPVNYHDAFLGFRYNQLSGRVWYLDQPDSSAAAQTNLYYQAGWTTRLNDRFSVSLQMGQTYSDGRFVQQVPDVSIAARAQFQDYGLGLRLMERTDPGLGERAGFSLMGSVSKPLP